MNNPQKHCFRVMPVGETTKISFKNEQEYIKWRIEKYTNFAIDPCGNDPSRHDVMPNDYPIYDIPPFSLRVK